MGENAHLGTAEQNCCKTPAPYVRVWWWEARSLAYHELSKLVGSLSVLFQWEKSIEVWHSGKLLRVNKNVKRNRNLFWCIARKPQGLQEAVLVIQWWYLSLWDSLTSMPGYDHIWNTAPLTAQCPRMPCWRTGLLLDFSWKTPIQEEFRLDQLSQWKLAESQQRLCSFAWASRGIQRY